MDNLRGFVSQLLGFIVGDEANGLGPSLVVGRLVIVPGTVCGDLRGGSIGSDLLAQLENGQTDGDDEGEKAELKGIPCLETEYTDSQRNQGHCLQQNEHHQRDQDLLQLALPGWKIKLGIRPGRSTRRNRIKYDRDN